MYVCMYVCKRIYGSIHTKVHALALSLLYAPVYCVLLQAVSMTCLLSMYVFKTGVDVYPKRRHMECVVCLFTQKVYGYTV